MTKYQIGRIRKLNQLFYEIKNNRNADTMYCALKPFLNKWYAFSIYSTQYSFIGLLRRIPRWEFHWDGNIIDGLASYDASFGQYRTPDSIPDPLFLARFNKCLIISKPSEMSREEDEILTPPIFLRQSLCQLLPIIPVPKLSFPREWMKVLYKPVPKEIVKRLLQRKCNYNILGEEIA